MTTRGFFAILMLLGVGWGLTQPLTKIAVSTGHQPLGLIFWQMLIGAVFLFFYRILSGKPLSIERRHLGLYVIIAMIGTIVPNAFSYLAVAELPSGVMSVVISLVPIFGFPIALMLGNDRFSWGRLAGLFVGLAGVLILAQPEALPNPAAVIWIPVALIAPLCYAFEGNYVARWGTQGLGPGHVLFGASLVGAVISLPLAVFSGQFVDPLAGIGLVEWALIGSSIVHVSVYSGYVWLVSRAGSVFASQTGYVVTGAGVVWAMILLGERYSLWVWAALGIIVLGLLLVRPRQNVSS